MQMQIEAVFLFVVNYFINNSFGSFSVGRTEISVVEIISSQSVGLGNIAVQEIKESLKILCNGSGNVAFIVKVKSSFLFVAFQIKSVEINWLVLNCKIHTDRRIIGYKNVAKLH